ncbi:phenylalanine--tRNA ligase subunit alpha [Candidatus Saccharibacteria bacterium]|nr:phenylalanine--tRNA ligase subunit alpha [Candidatus Saccharibacteria bacterium]
MDVMKLRKELLAELGKGREVSAVLKDGRLKGAYAALRELPAEERGQAGQKLNELRKEIERMGKKAEKDLDEDLPEIDKTAPFVNKEQELFELNYREGTKHPLTTEIDRIREIYARMGFQAVESRQIDDEFHMFDSLNFAKGHPARDNFDTFRTAEGFVPPAHTSVMQNRILRANKHKLEKEGQIAAISYGRCFRNEDTDATHEHTFYQCEGVYVAKDANLGQMIAVLREFFVAYYEQELKVKTQPAYFPFTEPSLEFLIEKPKLLGGKGGEWLEMLGCGMIHPNVLKMGGIDPSQYKGFAWGGGVDRLIMLRYGIDDIRYLESGKLRFLKEFR